MAIKLSAYKGQLCNGIQRANRYTFEVDGLFDNAEHYSNKISEFRPIEDYTFKVSYYAMLDDNSKLEHIVENFSKNLDNILDFKLDFLLNDATSTSLKYNGMIKLKDFYFSDMSWDSNGLLEIITRFEVKKIDIVKD